MTTEPKPGDDAAVQRASTPEQTKALARATAGLLRAGDLLVLTGGLGAGKTTFTQGLAEGLGVRGPITSPTFVVAREHPSLVDGPPLVHVDAYRLGGATELDDLDLDAELDRAVTVVEWGAGLAEELSASWLELIFSVDDQDTRTITYRGHGPRWADELDQLRALA